MNIMFSTIFKVLEAVNPDTGMIVLKDPAKYFYDLAKMHEQNEEKPKRTRKDKIQYLFNQAFDGYHIFGDSKNFNAKALKESDLVFYEDEKTIRIEFDFIKYFGLSAGITPAEHLKNLESFFTSTKNLLTPYATHFPGVGIGNTRRKQIPKFDTWVNIRDTSPTHKEDSAELSAVLESLIEKNDSIIALFSTFAKRLRRVHSWGNLRLESLMPRKEYEKLTFPDMEQLQ